MKYANRVLGVIVAVAAAPVAYVAAYLALLQPYAYNAIGGVARAPAYRCGDDRIEALFKPISDIDQTIRPGFWYRPGPYDPAYSPGQRDP